MQAPKRGDVLTAKGGQKWCVAEVTVADMEDAEVDSLSFLVCLVRGDDPDVLDLDGPELTAEEFQTWCDDHQISL